MCCHARAEGSPRGIIWLPAASVVIIERETGLRRNPGCTCCAGLVGSRCMQTVKSCGTLGELTRRGESICSTNQTVENSWHQTGAAPHIERGIMNQTIL